MDNDNIVLTRLNKYLEENPHATLKEGIVFYNNIVEIEEQKELERRKNEKDYFDSLIGKYFTIDFNTRSKMFFRVKEILSNIIQTEQTYEIYKDTNCVRIEINGRIINKEWFDNPYREEWKYFSSNHSFCKEISEEKFNELIKYVEEFKTINNKLFLMI